MLFAFAVGVRGLLPTKILVQMGDNIFQYMRAADERLDAKKITEKKSTNGYQTGPDPVTAQTLKLVKTIPNAKSECTVLGERCGYKNVIQDQAT